MDVHIIHDFTRNEDGVPAKELVLISILLFLKGTLFRYLLLFRWGADIETPYLYVITLSN